MPETSSDNRPIACEAIILFADIADSVEVAHERSVEEYDEFVQQFQESALQAKPAVEFLKADDRFAYQLEARGDEVLLVIQPTAKGLFNAVKGALAYAFVLKLSWIASRYNLGRLRNGQPPRDCMVGIHKGLVTVRRRPMPEREAAEGYAISFAKRIQQAARGGEVTRILASAEFESACRTMLPSVKFGKSVLTDLKGIGGRVRAAELELIHYSDVLTSATGVLKSLARCTDDATLALLRQRALANPTETWVVRLAAGAHLARARLVARESPNLAVKLLDDALAIWPDFTEAHNLLWSTLFIQGRLVEAVRAYQRAIEIWPDVALVDGTLLSEADEMARVSDAAGVYAGLADVYISHGHFAQGVAECDRALTWDQNRADVYCLRAIAKRGLGDLDGADEDYSRAFELDESVADKPPDG